MAKQIILTLMEDDTVQGQVDGDLSDKDIAWMLKCAEVELIEIMSEGHSSIDVIITDKPKE